MAARPPEGIHRTQFAHIGEITILGGVFHVAVERRILTGMLAPRGLAPRLLLFDINARLIAAYEPVFATRAAVPLWCEGARVYLAGFGSYQIADSLEKVEADPRLIKHKEHLKHADYLLTGNVLDFSMGIKKPLLTREMKYGSSGGIADDPWAVQGK